VAKRIAKRIPTGSKKAWIPVSCTVYS
jgi:hypothetical protein